MTVSAKTLVLSVTLIVWAIGATAPTSAFGFAPRWSIEKALLSAGKTRDFIAFNTEQTRLDSAALGVKISSPKGECVMTGKLVGSAFGKPGGKQEVALVCANTTVVEPMAGCTVKSPGQEPGTVTTAPMKSTLVWEAKEGEAAGDLYSAEGKGPIGEITLEGAMCSKKGTYAIEKETIGRLTPVAEHAKVLTQAFPEPPISKWWTNGTPAEEVAVTQLTLGGKATLIRSSFEVKISPEEAFGYFPG